MTGQDQIIRALYIRFRQAQVRGSDPSVEAERARRGHSS